MSFTNPVGITTDGLYLYVWNFANGGEILKIDSGGVVDPTFTCTNLGLNGMIYVSGFLYVCNSGDYTITKVDSTSGTTTTFAGISGTQGSTDGAYGTATLYSPVGITTDGTYFYVTDQTAVSGVSVIRRIDSTGAITTLTTSGAFGALNGIYYRNNKLYIANSSYGINTILLTDTPPYTITNVLPNTQVYDIISLNDTELYYSTLDNTIHLWNGATDTILAGATGVAGYVNANGVNARFNSPYFMTYASNLYISDYNNNAIRTLNLGTNDVTTFYGGPIPCIPAGQRIRTLRGDVRVETVKSGDYILTPDGRSVVVKVYKTTVLGNRHEAPYLIPANTFRPGYPKRDIQLSPKHKIQCGPDLWLSAEKAATLYPAITQIGRGSFIQYFHFETPDFLTDDLVVEGSVVESYGVNYAEKHLRATQPYVWSESHKAEIRVVPGHWRM
jgi:hypothetical protein